MTEGFQDIMRALPMSRAGNLELQLGDVCAAHMQHEDYGQMLVRTFMGMPVPKMGLGVGSERTERNADSTPTGNTHHRTLSHFLLCKADPLSATYSYARKDDLAEYSRQKMLAFLTTPAVVAAIGRRKCHEAAWFFETMYPQLHRVPTPQSWVGLSEALSRLLGEEVRVVPDGISGTGPSGTLLLCPGTRNGWRECRVP